jgi:GrpB-like predicted nucleotidyltransferase (UPF0157 family)
MIGSPGYPGRVTVAPPDPAWPAAFEAERARIQAALPQALHLEHIGSTSVPDLPAKPIVDLMLGLEDFWDATRWLSGMEGLGYRHFPDVSTEWRLFMGHGDPRMHHLHIVAFDAPEWRRLLSFRDRLRADAELRQAYAAEKQRLCTLHEYDRAAYTAAKAPFIQGVLGEVT